MITKLHKLNGYQKQVLLGAAKLILESWEEEGNPVVVWNIDQHEAYLNNEDNTILVLWKCECGSLIADYDDYSGRDIDTDRCSKCNRHYEYNEEELENL